MDCGDRRYRILVVDDTPYNLRTIKTVLEGVYDVLPAKSGSAALKMLEASIPDLILLDIEMPEMSGFEFMRKIKKDPVLAGVPVVCLTSHLPTGDFVEHVIKEGFEWYIRKPFETEALMEKIKTIIENHKFVYG